MIKRVVLGISGGVDSAVAALLLKTRGYDVQGVFMRNWDIADEKGHCRSNEDLKDASYVCDKLNIPLHQVNFVKEYWNEVFSHLIKDYENGGTPNPDILCNKNVKFKHFFKYARDCLKADAIATGHYARTSFGSYLENYRPNANVRLLQAQDIRKDQTFFLSQLQQQALRRTMFPLGDLMKWEVKHIAAEHGLERIALKPESMGICFIGSRNFQDFIKEYIEDKPGKFIDIDTGQVVGEHQGIHQWTLGQRSRVHGLPEPYFICQKNVEENVIYLAQGTKHPALYSSLFSTHIPHWISLEPPELKNGSILHCYFKFQHTNNVVSCEVCRSKTGLVVKLKLPKRALTPGQYAVFYRGDECLGSARIINIGASEFSLNYLRRGMRNTCNSDNECNANSELSLNKGS
ncbi:mitochondrial tRNA-specific 2-thiouridylase 1 [Euwallacea similis]|uniref:mitochondrial tRNA-specific 2-thiouridylase 1 n=1 Tax=Euwallacea similis TaxID=1736056 RepID=UPI00344BD127